MNQRGMTMIELILVITLIAIMGAFAFPRLGDAITKQDVRSARTLFIGVHARARAVAIQRGSRTSLIVDTGRLTIQSLRPVTNAVDTVAVEDLGARYGVTVVSSNPTLTFDGRGVQQEPAAETIVSITKGAYGTQIRISPVGRVWQ